MSEKVTVIKKVTNLLVNSINRKHISKSRFYCTLNKEEKLSYSRLRRKTRHASVFQVVILMQVLHLKFIHNINA